MYPPHFAGALPLASEDSARREAAAILAGEQDLRKAMAWMVQEGFTKKYRKQCWYKPSASHCL